MGEGVSRERRLRISLRAYHSMLERVRAILPVGLIINSQMHNRWIEVWTPDLQIALTLQFRWLRASNGETSGLWYINGKQDWSDLDKTIINTYNKVVGGKRVRLFY